MGLHVAVAVLIVAIGLSGTRVSIGDWAQKERSGGAAVGLAKTVVTADCPLYLANFDLERRVAIPRLLPFAHGDALPSCKQSSRRAYALAWGSKPLPSLLTDRCSLGWQGLEARRGVELYRCGSFRDHGIADQDATSGDPQVQAVRLRIPRADPSPSSLFQPRESAAGP
jgi:hypothetical protein